jgi:hypothetical protein
MDDIDFDCRPFTEVYPAEIVLTATSKIQGFFAALRMTAEVNGGNGNRFEVRFAILALRRWLWSGMRVFCRTDEVELCL